MVRVNVLINYIPYCNTGILILVSVFFFQNKLIYIFMRIFYKVDLGFFISSNFLLFHQKLNIHYYFLIIILRRDAFDIRNMNTVSIVTRHRHIV